MPISVAQFFDLFGEYNLAIWPAQVVAYAVGLAIVALITSKAVSASRIALVLLGLLWLWNGVAYHWVAFAAINPAAYGFAAIFIVGGAIFIVEGAARRRVVFCFRRDWSTIAGVALVTYALVGYSALGFILAHAWPKAPVFGVAPCPTVIFTLGVLLLSITRLPSRLVAAPLLWALVGSSATFLFGVLEDIGLAVAGITLLCFWLSDGAEQRRKNRILHPVRTQPR
jgi:hypothetical protein